MLKVIGQSPEAVRHEWSGAGWVDRGIGYSHAEAENIAHRVNLEFGEWIAWTEKI